MVLITALKSSRLTEDLLIENEIVENIPDN